MTHRPTRRGFMAASAATAAIFAMPRRNMAQSAALTLRATTRTLDVDGRAATVFGLTDGAGSPGLTLQPGQPFRLDLKNDLAEPTIIHWHGQIPPNVQDGVPDLPMPPLQPGETRSYDYQPAAGTHWMHSHIPLQEMRQLAAPLIVLRPEDLRADRQEVVMFLHDFSFRSPEEVLAEIGSGKGHGDADGMVDGAMSAQGGGHDMAAMGAPTGDGMSMAGMQMDLNDFDFDAYLTNDRTLNDPDIQRVEKGGRILLRVINAAAATVFWIDSGELAGRLVAVDGQPIRPVPGTRFGLAMGQRLDIALDLPDGQGAWPILALREGARERTGLILATAGAEVPKISDMADQPAPAFDLDLTQEAALQAVTPLPDRAADTTPMLMLGGQMQPYRWTINDRVFADRVPVAAVSGQRVEMTFHNMSMMGHPMHLNGHHFQVVAINGTRLAGALRDTVYVPPMARVTVALDAGEAAEWMLHCHHMPHMASGMMTTLAVAA
ncbi:multicopper oxidase family protein [Paracoccus fistulariae]|uniref:Multicopper oxidase family protein n=1 Tax=Paracoccus fistulariae TaxID=658446 RepID=A0ABY7SLB5_9RHOB|nr:multicopper oxidase family protein [Paracoccus fistulariae]MDB6182579.1 multicopper oxidase family protein [Paracoccus fistulariae]WCR07787.1 multicopper oxidase family protein [Paracoccus fistulariae]